MRTLRLFAVPMVAALALVAGCGSDTTADGGTDVDTSAGGEANDPSPSSDESEPTAAEPTAAEPSEESGEDEAIGTVLVSTALAVEAGDYPGPPVPQAAEVSDAADLAAVFSAAPGIEEVVAELEASAPDPESRLFAYVVGACIVSDVSLEVRGKKVQMVVHGNTGIRCEPPPVTMVVFEVPPDAVPADAVPSQAVIK